MNVEETLSDNDMRNDLNARQNLIFLRRRLKISQSELISRYLTDAFGRKMFSISKLSAVENGSAGNVQQIIEVLAGRLSMDPETFFMEPDEFAKNLDLFLENILPHENKTLVDISKLVKKTSRVEKIVQVLSDYIMDAILVGELKPGDKLPSDRALSEMLHIGRSSLREAMKVLDVMGLVNILHGQGTFVSPDSSDFLLAPLSWTFLVGNKNIEDILVVRNMLERTSARLAAENRAEGKDFTALTKAFIKLKDAVDEKDFQAFIDNDLGFHLAMSELCGNSVIGDLLKTIRRITRFVSATGMINLRQMDESYQEHEQIYMAIMQGNPEKADEVMQEHLKKAQSRYQIPHKK